MNSTNKNNASSTAAKEKQSFFRSNPVINRLNKVEERAGYDEKAAGYGRTTVFANQPQELAFNYKGFEVSTSFMQLGFFVGASILAIITQIISAFARPIIPVTGTIYSFCQGLVISFIVFTVIKGYEYLGLLALVITVAIVLTMGILYSAKIIKVTKKFRMVMLSLFVTMISVSIISFLGYLIPFTRPFVASILGNFWISLGLTIISIIIASLFLITDFATIDHVVTNKLPAKYEWSAAFGLAFTVLWIYVKILDLLIQIVGHSKN